MEGFPSNLNATFTSTHIDNPIMAGYPYNGRISCSPTEQFTQLILHLPPLYNAQWWGYESLTAIVLVGTVLTVMNLYMK